MWWYTGKTGEEGLLESAGDEEILTETPPGVVSLGPDPGDGASPSKPLDDFFGDDPIPREKRPMESGGARPSSGAPRACLGVVVVPLPITMTHC
jgi:hypothetical protein